MDRDEFLERMPLIDKELTNKGTPIHERAFHAFPLLVPNYNGPLLGVGIDGHHYGEYDGPNLLHLTNTWCRVQYGDRFNAPTDRGKVPVFLRQEVYLIRVPLVYGSPELQILPLVNGLTPVMARSLSQSELDENQMPFVEGYGLTYEFEDLMSHLEAEARNSVPRNDNPFLASAVRDKDTSADCLEGAIDTSGTAFHSQQLAEKMLKAVILNSTEMCEKDIRKKYNHRIPECIGMLRITMPRPRKLLSLFGKLLRTRWIYGIHLTTYQRVKLLLLSGLDLELEAGVPDCYLGKIVGFSPNNQLQRRNLRCALIAH
jgi:hypothetical protein